MAATVTIDKAYFETLLRRAEFHTSGRDLTTPVDIPVVSIPKVDHDNLLRMAQEYTSLRDALHNGGIEPETLEVLIRGESVPLAPIDTFVDDDEQASGGADLYSRAQRAQVTTTRPSGNWADSADLDWPSKSSSGGFQGYSKGKVSPYSRHNSSAQDDTSFTPDFEKDDPTLTVPRPERQQYARTEQRTILVKNLSDRTTHKDVVDFVRGGTVLDLFLRLNDRNASISFVEGAVAQDFMNYVRRNDIYVHGKRLEFGWNDRQFVLPGHVANKIGIGATRNLIIRNVHQSITEQRLRDDLDHIHNLVVISVSFKNGDAYISLNSIHNSLFARTCMMSRATYKGMRIEWYPDECCQPLPRMQYVPKKENLAHLPVKKFNPMVNRFQMLKMDEDGTEDSSEDELSSLNIHHGSPWTSRTVAI